jgi:hypothetical protein
MFSSMCFLSQHLDHEKAFEYVASDLTFRIDPKLDRVRVLKVSTHQPSN